MKLLFSFLIFIFSSTLLSAQADTDDCNDTVTSYYFEVSLTRLQYENLKKTLPSKCIITEICTCPPPSNDSLINYYYNSNNMQQPLQPVQYEYKNGQMVPVYNSQSSWQRSLEAMKRLGF